MKRIESLGMPDRTFMTHDVPSIGNILLELKQSAMQAIKCMLKEHHRERISFDTEDNLTVCWLDEKGNINCGCALEVYYDGAELSIKVERFPSSFYLKETKFPLSCHVWLENIKNTILHILQSNRLTA